MTYKKVLKVFEDYLAEDSYCEVLQSRYGYLVIEWGAFAGEWMITPELCDTPAKLRDALRFEYEEYLGYQTTDGYKRDLTSQEKQNITRMGAAIAARCEEDGGHRLKNLS